MGLRVPGLPLGRGALTWLGAGPKMAAIGVQAHDWQDAFALPHRREDRRGWQSEDGRLATCLLVVFRGLLLILVVGASHPRLLAASELVVSRRVVTYGHPMIARTNPRWHPTKVPPHREIRTAKRLVPPGYSKQPRVP